MISSIIPTLNEKRSLPGLLDVVQQQGAEHEVIVVDGGSQDRTREVAVLTKSKHSFLQSTSAIARDPRRRIARWAPSKLDPAGE